MRYISTEFCENRLTCAGDVRGLPDDVFLNNQCHHQHLSHWTSRLLLRSPAYQLPVCHVMYSVLKLSQNAPQRPFAISFDRRNAVRALLADTAVFFILGCL